MRKWIDIITESSEPKLEFKPRDGCWVFNGFDVHAELLGSPDTCLGVSSFTSMSDGRGNGERALRWLKTQSPALHVYDPGQPGDESFEFWRRMCDKGIVDSMEDEDNNVIYRDGEWSDGWPE